MDAVSALAEAIKARDAPRALALLREDPKLAQAALPDGPPPFLGAMRTEGLPLLQLAVYFRVQPVVDAMLAAGARPDVAVAAMMGDVGRVRALIDESRANLSRKSADGFPPLLGAAHFDRSEIVQLLLDMGADPMARSGPPLTNTALHAAAAGGAVECMRILLRARVTVDARDAAGNTPLMIAAANGGVEGVKLLLEKGADPNAKNNDGKTARDFAAPHKDVLALL